MSDKDSSDEIHEALLERIIKGESPETLLEVLRDREVSDEIAGALVARAVKEYEEAKQTGRLVDLEYDLAFRKKPQSRKTIGGVALISLGVLMSAGSYLVSAPGTTYTLYIGLIAMGAILLLLSPD
jgi:hypothetical protein